MRTTRQLLLGAIRPFEDSNVRFWQLLPHVDSIPRSMQSENVAHALAFCELYKSLGNWKACQELLEPAVSQLDRTVEGKADEDSLYVMSQLADALQRDRQWNEAEKLRREILTLRLEMFGQRHPDSISAMSNLAQTLSICGQLDEAEKMEREVLAFRLETSGPRHLDTVSATKSLAATLWRRRQFKEAEQMGREVLALRFEILGKRHPETISAINSLAVILYSRGQLDEAEKLEREVLDLRLTKLKRWGERYLLLGSSFLEDGI
ncbi:related to kinesin light chain [Serendipita indica DSM 11827]|uniref:Related to kinesin light chain n=1 Tax=Serendipita indica (strain DSM 11827) TaxID=1109443 RepID=G4TPD0_SERID|nr:related to kinesin light chain [Serendipita indica DSM 11827]